MLKILRPIGMFCLASLIGLPSALSAEIPPPETTLASPAPAAAKSEQEFDIRVPRWKQIRPKWALQITGTPFTFHTAQTVKVPAASVHAFELSGEYLFLPTEKFGVLGLGPSAGIYPRRNETGTYGIEGWSVGAQVRYQAKFFHEQIVVPTIAYEMEYWKYSLNKQSGHLLAQGPAAGVMIFLNSIDPDTATGFFTELGVSRSYLLVEARQVYGHDVNVSLSSRTYFFGLRFEL